MNTKIALFQFNPHVGNIHKNTQAIIEAAKTAKAQGATILLTPELALSGYPAEDLLFHEAFWQQIQAGLDLIEQIDDIVIVVGHPSRQQNQYHNSASVYFNGNRLGVYHKMLLPNESVFDEVRYFEAGVNPLVFEHNQIRFGLIICEDIWHIEPAAEAVEQGAQILLCLNASPFYLNKENERIQNVLYRIEENQVPLIYLNMVGGQDELIFDGASFAVNQDGVIAFEAEAFKEDIYYLQTEQHNQHIQIKPSTIAPKLTDEALLYQALVYALRDYVHKSGFKKICLGLSGGIDSALVLAIAADALGSDNCEVILMPSRYTADISVTDAQEMAIKMGIKHHTIAITPLFEQFKQELSTIFNGLAEDVTEENLQARIRGTLLMALSNKTGALLLATGNKSELATGYCTLYGDMNGGFAPIKDLFKTQVYALSRYRNTLSEIIPTRIIDRAPSAELRDNQTDQDSLPEYPILDAMLQAIMQENADKEQLIKQGFKAEETDKVLKLIQNSEYKRRQGAIGPKVSPRAFGKDWRMPICNGFKQ
ncbi:NAD+ synthase [Neisseria sp. Ec49-e6-T10]|uniref:NAD+ synthase n=1 Tax=Neisseria sp. Ec49-e6-T10 TaxID=3140744 RepID=UPI003EBC6855